MDYKGSECIVCRKRFGENDDVVVCPECGTPYHRECYTTAGKCINTVLHERGESWSAGAVKKAVSVRKCRMCGGESPADALFCCKCGVPFNTFDNINGQSFYEHNTENEEDSFMGKVRPSSISNERDPYENQYSFRINFSDPLCGMNPSEEYDENVNLAELGAFVDSNTVYYLPRFKIMKEAQTKVSTNFLAFLFPELFFANRKMPAWAIFSLIIAFFTTAPTMIAALAQLHIETGIGAEIINMFDIRSQSFQTLLSISEILRFVYKISMFLFANNLYFSHCLNKIPDIKKRSQPNVLLSELHASGGTSVGGLITVLILEVIFFSVYYLIVYSSI